MQVDFQLLNEKGETSSFIANGEWALLGEFLLDLEMKVREDFTITEKAPTSANFMSTYTYCACLA